MNQRSMQAVENKFRGNIVDVRKQMSAHIERMRTAVGHLDAAELALIEKQVGYRPWGRKKAMAKAAKKTVGNRLKAYGRKTSVLRKPSRKWAPIVATMKSQIDSSTTPLNNNQLWEIAKLVHPDLKGHEREAFNNIVRGQLRKSGYRYEGTDRLHLTWRRQPAEVSTATQ